LLENNGVTIWLDCPLEVLERRVARAQHRPLARDLERFRSLYQARREAYAKADYRIEVGDADATVHVQSIMKLPLF
jgi:shikimate kinase